MQDLMEAIGNFNKAKLAIEEAEKELKYQKDEQEKARKLAQKALHTMNGYEEKWVYYDSKLYGLSCDDWGGHSCHLKEIDVDMKKLSNGDTIADWTGKLGYRHVEVD